MMRPYFLLIALTVVALSLPAQRIDPAQIDIIRDQWGVPHIDAPTDEAATYGLAWAHAEDDFETIQLPLISAKRMLGRHLGKGGAAVDYVAALLRLEETAKRYQRNIDPKFRKLVNAYAAAMNAFAEKYPNRVLVSKAFPITELDVLKAYGLSLSVISGADGLIKNLYNGKVEPVASWGATGSNAIAVSRKKTDDEYTYLAVNSHQPLEGPVAWYEAHVVSDEGWNMMGGMFPGAPVILHGTNENLGWAHTVNYPDKIDTYQLELNPDDEDQYRVDGRWKTLEKERVKLKVKVFGVVVTVKRDVLWSDFGPALRNDKGVFAFRMSTLDDISAIEQWYYMNKSRTFEEFRNILKDVSNPGFNIVYADAKDHIYHIGYGKIPVRKKGYDWGATLPGNKEDLWSGKYHGFDDLPQNLDPSSGFIFNTNNSAFSSSSEGNNPDPDKYDPTMGYRVWENNRSSRLLQLMSEQESLSYDRFKTIKYDLTLPDSLMFPIDVNALLRAEYRPASAAAREVKNLISRWDRKADKDAIGPAQAMLTYEWLNRKHKTPYRTYFKPPTSDLDSALVHAHEYLTEHFGKVDVRLDEFQFLVRGDKKVPIHGMNDVLAAMNSKPQKDGTRHAVQGESYIMLVRYPEQGLPIIETVNVYGSSNQPNSPHYDDQMGMFANQQLKPMTLDIDEVRKKAKRVYHPE
ncbi:MAG: penicillin acylase family protein [Cytophagales bacterium]|nr:penicillin acylase family protein [Cytophagales bacterium]